MKTGMKIALALIGIGAAVYVGQQVRDALTATVSSDTLKREAKYEGYARSGVKEFGYDEPASYALAVPTEQAEPTYDGLRIPVRITRDGWAKYIYGKGSKRVFVEMNEFIPYPKCILETYSLYPTTAQPEIPVTIRSGSSTQAAVIRIEHYKAEDTLYHYAAYLCLDKATMKSLRTSRNDAEFFIEGQQVASLSFQAIDDINDVRTYDAESYTISFTQDNLDKALRFYEKAHDDAKVSEIKELLTIIDGFRKFHWSDDQISENPKAKEAQGFVLNGLKSLYWSDENTVVFGTTVRVNESDSEMMIYNKYSFMLPDVRVYMNDKGEEKDVVSGMITVDPHEVDPTQNRIDQWIVSYTGRKPLEVDGKTVYLPAFHLKKIVRI